MPTLQYTHTRARIICFFCRYRSDPVEILHLDMNAAGLLCAEGDTERTVTASASVTSTGVVDAIAVWWDVVVGEGDSDTASCVDDHGQGDLNTLIYSTSVEAERVQGMQDHWMQCMAVLPVRRVFSAGDVVSIEARFDGNVTLTVRLAHSDGDDGDNDDGDGDHAYPLHTNGDVVGNDIDDDDHKYPLHTEGSVTDTVATSRSADKRGRAIMHAPWTPQRILAATCPSRGAAFASAFGHGGVAAVARKVVRFSLFI